MSLKRMAVLMLLCAAACGIVAYESYRFNAVAVERMLANTNTQQMFNNLEAGIPLRSKIMGFCAIVFAVAGLKLLFSTPSSAEKE